MNRIIKILARLMDRLSKIPGLRFLQDYVMEARGAQVAFGQRKGDYESYMLQGTRAVGDVGELAGRKKKPLVEGDGSFDDEEYDEYDELDDSVYDDSSTYDSHSVDHDPEYPPSDDFNAYYNDDYRSY